MSFTESLPVAESHVLAYSCAAARDSHPLPCLRRAAKTRVPKRNDKERLLLSDEFTCNPMSKSNAALVDRVFRYTSFNVLPRRPDGVQLPRARAPGVESSRSGFRGPHPHRAR